MLTIESAITTKTPVLRVHIAAIGFEVDRIVKPAIDWKADRVWLLVHSRPGEDEGIPFREKIETALKNARIEYKHIDADRTDLFDTLRALSSIIMLEKNNLIYVNVSVGSKIQAIASMMACMMFKDSVAMIKPYYVVPEKYSTPPKEQETQGVKKIIDLPEYKIETPADNLIRCMETIDEYDGKITKKELKDRALKDGLIHLVKKSGGKEPSAQAPFMSLNKNFIEPLLKWKFIQVKKDGSRHLVYLTKEGSDALKFLRVRIVSYQVTENATKPSAKQLIYKTGKDLNTQ